MEDATLAAAAILPLRAQAIITLEDAWATAMGGAPSITGAIAATLDDLTLIAPATLDLKAAAAIQLDDAVVTATVKVVINAQATITLEDAEPSPIMLTGDISATADQTVVVPATADTTQSGAGLPLGALAWKADFDPADRSPRAFNFTPLLNGAKVAAVLRITMSAGGAAVGLMVDDDTARQPIIGTDGQRVQLWFFVDEALQNDPTFADGGVQVGISVKIQTDASPPQEYERTGVLTVRQL